MAILYQFGGYAYPKSTIVDVAREMMARSRFGDTPGRAGQYTAGGLLAPRPMRLTGHLIPLPTDSLDTLTDALFAAHAPGAPKPLFLGRDDRFVFAEVTGFRQTNSDRYPVSCEWEAQFTASDPHIYGTANNTVTLTAGGTATTNGTAFSLPVWTISTTAATAGNVGTVTITNTTTGRSFTLSAPLGGTMIVDCRNQQVRDNATGIDRTALFTSGTFWDFAPGANTITVSTTGGVAVQTLSAQWTDRWI